MQGSHDVVSYPATDTQTLKAYCSLARTVGDDNMKKCFGYEMFRFPIHGNQIIYTDSIFLSLKDSLIDQVNR